MATEWTDADIDAYLKRQESGATETAPRPHGIVIGSLLRGIDNLQGSLYGAGALIADAADAIDTREWMLDGYLKNNREAALNPAEVASWRDVYTDKDGNTRSLGDSLAKASTYAIEGVMENLPSMVPAMVTGGGAAILAGAGRRALAAGIGAYAANWAQEAGSIYGDIKERTGINAPGTAAGYGAAAAALDTASDLLGVGHVMGAAERKAISGVIGAGLSKEITKRLAARVGEAGAKQFLVEGGTEAIQTAIEEAAVSHEDPTIPLWTPQTIDKIIDSAIKGGIAGGAFGAAGRISTELTPQAQQTRTALDQANAMLEQAQNLRDSGAPQTAAALEQKALSVADVADIPEPPPVDEQAALQAELDAANGAVSKTDKNPWEMTQSEYVDRVKKQIESGGGVDVNGAYLAAENHREMVRDAIKEGKTIPEEVLSDYPSLKQIYQTQNATVPVGEPAPVVLGAEAAGKSGELGLQQMGEGNAQGQEAAKAEEAVKPPIAEGGVPVEEKVQGQEVLLSEAPKEPAVTGPEPDKIYDTNLSISEPKHNITTGQQDPSKGGAYQVVKLNKGDSGVGIPIVPNADPESFWASLFAPLSIGENPTPAEQFVFRITNHIRKQLSKKWIGKINPTSDDASDVIREGSNLAKKYADEIGNRLDQRLISFLTSRKKEFIGSGVSEEEFSGWLDMIHFYSNIAKSTLSAANVGPNDASSLRSSIAAVQSHVSTVGALATAIGNGRSKSELIKIINDIYGFTSTPDYNSSNYQPASDRIESFLNKAIEATNPQGKAFDFVAGVSYAVANTILRTARALYRTGKSVSESIKEAIRQHRIDTPDAQFDEAALEAKLNDVIQTEMAAPEPAQPATPQPTVTLTQESNPPKLSKALEFIKEPPVQYRTASEKWWRESAKQVIDAFDGKLRDALNYISRPKEMSGITEDIAVTAAADIAQRASEIWKNSTNPVEQMQARQLMRDATEAAKRIASKEGQGLRAVQTAAKIFNAGTAAAEYENIVSENQQREVADGLAQDVANAANEAANAEPTEDQKDKLLAAINKLRVKLGPVSWKQVFGEARASQIDFARSIFRVLTESRAGGDREARVQIANELSKEFWDKVNKERIRNALREVERLTKDNTKEKVKKAVAGAVPELIRLANAGVLDYQAARNAIATKLGLKPFNEDTARRIYEAAQKAQEKPPGAQRDTAIRQVLNMIPKETGISKVELAKTAWYGGVLTGLQSQTRNFTGSVLNLANEFAALSYRSPNDIGRMSMALLRGFRDSATTEFGAIMRGAEPSRPNADVRQAGLAAEILADDPSKWKRLFSNYRYVSRFMQAVDSLWYDASQEVRATFDAAAKGRLANASDIDAYIQNELKLTKEDRQRARAQAEDEVRRGLTDPKQVDRRTLEIQRQLRPADIQENADKFALYSTFNNDPEGFMGLVYRQVIQAREKYPVLTALVPFARISANVTNAFINASPLAIIRLIGNRPDGMQIPGIGDKLRYGKRRLTVDEWQQMRARIIVSGVSTIGLAALAISTKDDKDPWFQITGSLKTLSPSRRQQLEEQGIRPYQVRIGGKGIDYKLSPTAMMLAAIGNWSDSLRYGKDDPEAYTQLEAVLSAGHAIILDQSFLSGIGQLLEKPQNNQGFFDKFQKFITGTVGGFIPSVAKEIDSWLSPDVKQAKGFRENMQRQIPVARWFLERPLYNVLGEPVERPRYPWSWAVKGENEDPVWQALAEKAAKGVFVPVVSASAKVNGVKMTDEQFNRYQKIAGDLYRKKLTNDLERFRNMTPEQAKKYFEKEFDGLREQARRRIH